MRRFIRRFRVNYPVLRGTRETKALFIEGKYLPVPIVIARDGTIRERTEGILLPEEFEGLYLGQLRR